MKMSTILNKVVPNRKVQVRIIKEGFSSPLLGYPNYIGKIVTLNAATAKRFIDHGIAELVTDEKEDDADHESESSTENSGGGAAETLTLEDALKRLDPADDAHWTKGGLPDLNVLKELTGQVVKRQDVDDVAEGYTREVAAENKG